MTMQFVIFALCAITISTVLCGEDNKVVRARVESCSGCSLNRLHEVKKFVYEDLPKYELVEFKRIQGAPPELVLLNETEDEIQRIPLSSLNREECNALLVKHGFNLKSESSSYSEL